MVAIKFEMWELEYIEILEKIKEIHPGPPIALTHHHVILTHSDQYIWLHCVYIKYQKFQTFLISHKALLSKVWKVRILSGPYFLTLKD